MLVSTEKAKNSSGTREHNHPFQACLVYFAASSSKTRVWKKGTPHYFSSIIVFSIIVGLNNAVVWIVTTRPLISKSSRPCTNPLMTIPRAPITIGITVTFLFHSFFLFFFFVFVFFQFPNKSRYLSFFSLSFNFTLWSAGTAKSTILLVLFFSFFFFVIVEYC